MTNDTEKMPERIYLTDWGFECGECGRQIGVADTTDPEQSPYTLYVRADLTVPRADVMELVSLIDCLIQNNPDDSISDAGHTVLQLWRHDAQRALTNFKQKYGEDIAKS